MKKIVLSALIASCVFTVSVSATTRLVPSEYPNIQMAIQDCVDGDTVIVSPGVYYETINFGGRDITVTGTDPNDPKIVGYTIIDADGDGSTVTFENGETSAAVLTGFTITGGFGTLNNSIEGGGGLNIFWGAGIYCMNAAPTITRNIITRNYGPTTADLMGGGGDASYGGGIAAIFCSPTITHNIIRNNIALAGGGIILYAGSSVISNNIVSDNSGYIGGGVVLLGGSLINNTVTRNDCDEGPDQGIAGNVYAIFDPGFGRMQITGNIISDAVSGGGIVWEGDMAQDLFRYNDVWNNTMADFVSIDSTTGNVQYDGQSNRTGTMGNISADPRFVNPFNRDYHLTFESPCIDAGDPDWSFDEGQIDIDGESRVHGLRIDIGADEYHGYVKPVAVAGFDQHFLQPFETVALDGSRSFFYDPCGVKTFRWTQVEGAPVALSDPNAATVTFVPEAMGRYAFELVVADDQYASEADQVVVLVGANQPPVASAGADRVWQMPGQAVLDGTGSYDPDGVDQLRYAWKQVSGPPVELQNADTATPSFACDVEGQYAFDLIVNDGFVDSPPSRMNAVTVGVTKSLLSKSIAPTTGTPSYYLDMSSNRIVCATGLGVSAWQIAYKDLSTGATETFTGGGMNTQPKIDGDLVVWTGGASFATTYGPVCTSVFARNVNTGVQQTLRAGTDTSSFSHPAVSGNKVVWVEHRGLDRNSADKWYNMPYDICGADISDIGKPKFFTIATAVGRRDPFPLNNPTTDYDVVDICDDMVVWEGQGNIYAALIHDINDIRVVTVCDDPARQFDPAISDRFVVWTDQRNDQGDVYGADISDLDDIREFEVAKKPGYQQQPAIDGRQIVYVTGGGLRGSAGIACQTRKYGFLDTDLPDLINGVAPALDGATLAWALPASGTIQGYTLSFGYSIFDGDVQNARTARRYDYIQHAISDANTGDEVVAGQRAYVEQIDFLGKAVTVRSSDPTDPRVVSGTVIQNRTNLVTFANREGADSILDGLTILWGDNGVFCVGTSPTIKRCNITANRRAGLLLQNQSNPTLIDCRITANEGPGIEMSSVRQGRVVRYSLGTIRNCIIAANRHEGISGGKPTVINCTIVENLREGITATVPTVTNSIIYFNNRSGDGSQIYSNFATVTYSDVEGGWEGDGNIQADPNFVKLGQWVGADEATGDPGAWWAGDYHLKSQGLRWDTQTGSWVSDAVTSPCIDAGDPASELFDELLTIAAPGGEQYVNTRIDMGAYGGTPEASFAPLTQ
jgi:beta propeller repeat protein